MRMSLVAPRQSCCAELCRVPSSGLEGVWGRPRSLDVNTHIPSGHDIVTCRINALLLTPWLTKVAESLFNRVLQ